MFFRTSNDLEIPSDDTIIWRYSDFTKFVSLIDTSSLFFPTLELLRKIDLWEGSFLNFRPAQMVGVQTEEDTQRTIDMLNSLNSKYYPKRVVVSCWHMNKFESDAMWKLYLSNSMGLAIKTTVGSLKKAFDDTHKDFPQYHDSFPNRQIEFTIGKVKYVDWNAIDWNTNMNLQAFNKSMSFAHEQEMRVVSKVHPLPSTPPLVKLPEHEKYVEDETFQLTDSVYDQLSQQNGVLFPLDLDILIEDIYIVPTAQDWFYELVQSVISKYGYSFNIIWNRKAPPKY